MTRFRVLVILTRVALVVVVAGSALAGSAMAAPPAVSCGQVIIADTTLHHDVGPCPGDGLIVGADNITLNLNGYRILGQARKTGNYAGVRIPNRTGVAVIGGRLDRVGQPVAAISGFDAGVFINGGSANAVRNLVVRDNIGLESRDALLGDGIAVFNSSGNTIQRNVIDHNGIYDGIGVLGPDSHGNVVRDNTVTRTAAFIIDGSAGEGTGAGIVIDAFLDAATGRLIRGNDVLKNVVAANDGAGISNVNTQDARVAGNIVEDNGHVQYPGTGIGLRMGQAPQSRSGRMVIENNVVRRNGRNGIETVDTDQNSIVGNLIEGNGFQPARSRDGAAGILVESETGGNLIKGNTVRGNNYSGIWLSANDGHTYGRTDNNRIEGNTVSDNAVVGIIFMYANGDGVNHIVSNYVVNSGLTEFGDLVDGGTAFFGVPDCGNTVWDANTYEIATPSCAANGGTQVSVESSSGALRAVDELAISPAEHKPHWAGSGRRGLKR